MGIDNDNLLKILVDALVWMDQTSVLKNVTKLVIERSRKEEKLKVLQIPLLVNYMEIYERNGKIF